MNMDDSHIHPTERGNNVVANTKRKNIYFPSDVCRKRSRLDSELSDEEAHSSGSNINGKRKVANESIEIGSKKSKLANQSSKTYAKSGLVSSLHGVAYQLKMLMLVLFRALKHEYEFRLATEMDVAEKFDDIVFQYKDGGNTIHRCFQLKHFQDETRKISVSDLFGSKNKPLSLEKYLISYVKMKKGGLDILGDIVICTNIDFNFDSLKESNINIERIQKEDDIIIDETNAYKLTNFKKSALYPMLTENYKAYKAAQMLVQYTYEEISEVPNFEYLDMIIDKEGRFQNEFLTNTQSSHKEKKTKRVIFRNAVQEYFFDDVIKPRILFRNIETLFEKIKKKTVKMSQRGENWNKNSGKLIFPPDNEEMKNLAVELIRYIFLEKHISFKNQKFKTYKNAIENYGIIILQDKQYQPTLKTDINDSIKDFKEKLLSELLKPIKLFSSKTDVVNWIKSSRSFKTSKTESFSPDIQSEIDEFFEKLIFAVKQPNEMKLGEILNREIGREFNLLNADLIRNSYQVSMLDWFKEKLKEYRHEGRFITCQEGMDIFKEIKRRLSFISAAGQKKQNKQSIAKYGILFTDEHIITHVLEWLRFTNGQINVVSTTNILLTTVKMFQALEYYQQKLRLYREKDSYHLITPDTIPKNQKKFKELAEMYQLLILQFSSSSNKSISTFYVDVLEMLKQNKNVKIILIIHKSNKIVFRKFKTHNDYCFNDLSQKTKDEFSEREVLFQGDKVPLKTLIPSSEVCSETVLKLITDIDVEVGTKLKCLAEECHYYIDRVFRPIDVSSKIFQNNSFTDLVAITNVDERTLTELVDDGRVCAFQSYQADNRQKFKYIILGIEQQFQLLRDQQPGHNIHLLNYDNGILEWLTSHGSLKNLMPFIENKNESDIKRRCRDESEFLKRVENQKVVVISNEAGMGKSLLLSSISLKIKKSNRGLWVIRINLNDCTKELQKDMNKYFRDYSKERAVQFVGCRLLQLDTLALQIFYHQCYNGGKIVLLFDGFDEISPTFEKYVFVLLEALEKTEVKQIFITTRTHVKDELQTELQSIAFSLNPLRREDQKNLLIKFWLREGEEKSEEMEVRADKLIDLITLTIKDREYQFTGVPLQVKMVAEAYEEDSSIFTDQQGFEVTKLYEFIVKKKLKLYREEKTKTDISNTGAKFDTETLYEVFVSGHQKLALDTLFTKDLLKKIIEPGKLVNIKKREEKTGIVDYFINGKAHFIHRTFAEYFAADYFIHQLTEAEHTIVVMKLLLTEAFTKTQYGVFRSFIDEMLSRNLIDNNFLINWKGKNEKKLLAELKLCGDIKSSVQIAIQEGKANIGNFVFSYFKNEKSILRELSALKDENGETLLHLTLEAGRKLLLDSKSNVTVSYELRSRDTTQRSEILKLLIRYGAKINSRNKYGETPLHLAVKSGNFKGTNSLLLVQLLLQSGAQVTLGNNKGETALHLAVVHGSIEVVNKLIEAGANVNAINKNGDSVLHYALKINELGNENDEEGISISEHSNRSIPESEILELVKLIAENTKFSKRKKDISTAFLIAQRLTYQSVTQFLSYNYNTRYKFGTNLCTDINAGTA